MGTFFLFLGILILGILVFIFTGDRPKCPGCGSKFTCFVKYVQGGRRVFTCESCRMSWRV